MKHSLMISWKKKKETFCLLRGTVLWEKRKHSYYSSSNHLLYYYILWDCFQVSCFPGSKPWAEPPWCVGMFWQAWALTGELSLDPLGSKGCAPQPLAAEIGSWLCKGSQTRLWATRWTWAPWDPHLSTPHTLRLRECWGALYLLTQFLDKG